MLISIAGKSVLSISPDREMLLDFSVLGWFRTVGLDICYDAEDHCCFTYLGDSSPNNSSTIALARSRSSKRT